MKSLKLVYIVAFAIMFCSCSLLEPLFGIVSKNVNITWGKDSTGGKPIDSLIIKNAPAYWRDSTKSVGEIEKEFYINGYRIWQLSTPVGTRYEIQRLDSTLYFYEKK